MWNSKIKIAVVACSLGMFLSTCVAMQSQSDIDQQSKPQRQNKESKAEIKEQNGIIRGFILGRWETYTKDNCIAKKNLAPGSEYGKITCFKRMWKKQDKTGMREVIKQISEYEFDKLKARWNGNDQILPHCDSITTIKLVQIGHNNV